ncbi:MAG: DUF4012 domain-containing protein, partial [Streptomyces sp.]|uniref:DUF4012 domain-containing protein n=1 Tax=Streptomyces sp. TaxID=1931 RepID=UPI0025E633CE
MRLALLITGAVLGIAVAWLVVTGLLARAQLNAVRGDLDRLRAQIHAGDLPAARKTAERIANAAARAHRLTTGPAWAGAAALPWLGDPVDTVRVVAAQADALGHRVLPALVQASGDLDPAQLRRPDGSFNLDRISAVAPLLARADSAMQRAAGAVRRAPGGGWLPPVGSARSQVLTRLTSLARTVHSADLAAALAPDLLGAHGPRRYFVAFQNEAEARGTGGIPGAFAIARTDHGRITFERFESDSALATTAVDLDLGPDYEQLFRGAGT